MSRASAFIVLLLAASACSDRAAPASGPAPDSPPAVDAEADRTLRPGVPLDVLLAARGDDASVLGQLRPPRTVRAAPEPNRHVEGQTDSVRTYAFDGMTIEAYEVSGGPTFIQRITVTGGDYGTASGLAVDALRADVEAVLGRPVQEGGPGTVYETDDPAAPTVVTVVYEPDEQGRSRVARITWEPYVD